MSSSDPRENISVVHHAYFRLTDELSGLAVAMLSAFNSKNHRLSELPPEKRISLFFLARSMKTFSAVVELCREGFGQDVMPLLRSFLENLISLKYILIDPRTASQKTLRFVDYKWVIFKRYMKEDEEMAGEIAKQCDEFKKRYRIVSDKALLTWSGKTIRDMARAVDKNLLAEYELNFRVCSRFSHPGIIGDKEYIDYREDCMIFSYSASSSGIAMSLGAALQYLLDLLLAFEGLFDLGFKTRLDDFRQKFLALASAEKGKSEPPTDKAAFVVKKDFFVKFRI